MAYSTFAGWWASEDLISEGYYKIMKQNSIAVTATEAAFKKAVEEEQQKNKGKGFPEHWLTVFDDGSWPKRGFAALLGIVSLIREFSNIIIDVTVKPKICNVCKNFQFPEGSPEFDARYKERTEKKKNAKQETLTVQALWRKRESKKCLWDWSRNSR